MPRFRYFLTLGLTALLPLIGCSREPSTPAHAGEWSVQQLAGTTALPPEVLETLARIRQGGPYPYRKDGTTFQNRERQLPSRPKGYYREFTVPTPGSPDRGARRIVAGGQPPEVFYYSADHYRSFRRIEGAP